MLKICRITRGYKLGLYVDFFNTIKLFKNITLHIKLKDATVISVAMCVWKVESNPVVRSLTILFLKRRKNRANDVSRIFISVGTYWSYVLISLVLQKSAKDLTSGWLKPQVFQSYEHRTLTDDDLWRMATFDRVVITITAVDQRPYGRL
jgi:hypothetical protein